MPDEPRPPEDGQEEEKDRDPVADKLAEIDARIQEARGQAKFQEPPSDERMAQFEESLKKHRETRRKAGLEDDPDTPVGGSTGFKFDRSAGIAISAAYTLVGAVIGGWGLGWVVDQQVGSGNLWQGILTLVGAVAGIAGIILMVYRQPTQRK